MRSSSKKNICLLNKLVFVLFTGALFFSCSKDLSETEFLNQLKKIDTYIATNQYSDAISLLKKSEKKTYSVYSRISLYRRYASLGEEKSCERVLINALKKFPDNQQLSALYAKYLLNHNQLARALDVSKCLSGGKYGSIYSEAVIKNLKDYDKFVKGEYSGSLLDEEMGVIYNDIYNSTGNTGYLINRALISLAVGKYSEAASFECGDLENSKDCLFWALVHYDNKNYDRVITLLDCVKSPVLQATAASLLSDSYVMVGDGWTGEEVRKSYIDSYDISGASSHLLINSCLWAYRNEDYKRAYDLLINALSNENVDKNGLITYGKLAWLDNQSVAVTPLEQAVRKTTMRTAKMKAYDERPKFVISDAMDRLRSAIENQKKDGNVDPFLLVEYLSLYMRINEGEPLKSKTALLWKTLEQNEIQSNLYPAVLVRFCVNMFLSYGLYDDARNLFTNYLNAKYSLLSSYEDSENEEVKLDIFGGEKKIKLEYVPQNILDSTFGELVSKNVSMMDIWEIETAAYFALLDKKGEAAQKLFEYIVFDHSYIQNKTDFDVRYVVTDASDCAVVNLAMIYASMGDVRRALSLYGLAAGRTKDVSLKSKILYTTAYLQHSINEDEKALLSLNYCLALDPGNVDARLLKIKINRK